MRVHDNVAALNKKHQQKNKEDVGVIMSKVSSNIQDMLINLGLDILDPGLIDTSNRMARMYVKEALAGLFTPAPVVTTFANNIEIDQLYTIGPIQVRSLCEHHFLPILGQCWIGFLPEQTTRLPGLSKFARIVDWVMRRPQMQERATKQVADFIEQTIPQLSGLAVVVRASHTCMTWRGVQEINATMVTSELKGELKNNIAARSEFYSLIKGQGF